MRRTSNSGLCAEAYSKHCQTSKMELLGNTFNGYQLLIILAKKLSLRCFNRVLNTLLLSLQEFCPHFKYTFSSKSPQ